MRACMWGTPNCIKHQILLHAPSLMQGSRAGGVWVYTDETEEGEEHAGAAHQEQQQQQQRHSVHSSMYRNLRTNLPREVMSYTDFPFTRVWRDPRRFCGHEEVLKTQRKPKVPQAPASSCQLDRMRDVPRCRHQALAAGSPKVNELFPDNRVLHGPG